MSFTVPKPPEWPRLPLYKKIQHYRNHLDARFFPFVDKLEAKRIVKEVCGDAIEVARLVRVLATPDDLRQEDLHPEHIIKASHGCKWNINVTEQTDLSDAKTQLSTWNCPYNSDVERQYAFLEPRFFIEEKINDVHSGRSGHALVYMIRCIHGIPVTIGVKGDGDAQNSYDLAWNPIVPLSLPFSVPMPPQLYEMSALAKQLSKPFEFVRVDFHLAADGRIFFSEFTFTPAGGSRLYPHALENMLGAMWT
jgi:hypothetical protein